MKLNKQSQLWEFIDRYISEDESWEFRMGNGTVCDLFKGFCVALVKCSLIVFVAFIVLNWALAPFYGALMYFQHGYWMSGEPDIPSVMILLGCIVYAMVAVCALTYAAVNLWENRSRTQGSYEQNAFTVMVKERYAGFKGKYCDRVVLE